MDVCEECGRLDCVCRGGNGPKHAVFQGTFGNDDPWATTPPKTTNQQPRLGSQPWNNTPNQQPLENKVGQ